MTYVDRAPHEAFFAADGHEVCLTVRGENYGAVPDGTTYMQRAGSSLRTVRDADLPPDGKYCYLFLSFNPGNRRHKGIGYDR
jgi:hypothetical protein